MVRFEIDKKKTALLLIDMQNAFLQPGRPFEVPRGRAMLPRLNPLIAACRKSGIAIIHSVHVLGDYGGQIGLWEKFSPAYKERSTLIKGSADIELYHGLNHAEDDIVIEKSTYNAFYGTELEYVLHVRGIETLIIGGVVTSYCCESAAREARHRNYQVIFLSDGNAPYDSLPDMGWGEISGDEVQRVVLTILAYRYAEVAPISAIIDRIASIPS